MNLLFSVVMKNVDSHSAFSAQEWWQFFVSVFMACEKPLHIMTICVRTLYPYFQCTVLCLTDLFCAVFICISLIIALVSLIWKNCFHL